MGDTITLLQERYAGDPWSVLVASLCLKRTTRTQAEDVVAKLLDRYPTPESLLGADRSEVEVLLRPLGLWRTRADELGRIADRLSDEGAPETRAAALESRGVGEYMANSTRSSCSVTGRSPRTTRNSGNSSTSERPIKNLDGEMFAVTITLLRSAVPDAMNKHAFLLLSPPENPGKIANPLEYAAQLDEAGHDVVVWFDGGSTFWFENLADRPAPALDAYETAKERDLIAGVCNHCATHKGVVKDVEAEGFEITGEDHQPDVELLVEDGYELHIV